MSGEVLEINESLEEEPELVNEDPHGDGWMVKIKVTDITEYDSLMSSEEYDEYVAEEQESAMEGHDNGDDMENNE
jgi:glycine cleavage system H protein